MSERQRTTCTALLLLFVAGVPLLSVMCGASLVRVAFATVFVFVALVYFTAKAMALGYSGRLVLLGFLAGTVSLIFTFALIYQRVGVLGPNGEDVTSFEECFYVSVATWTTLGYSDLRPSEPARLFAAFEALAGYVFMALGIGIVINLLTEDRAHA